MSTMQQVSVLTNEAIAMSGIAIYQRGWKYDNKLWDVLAQVMDIGNHDLLNHSIRVSDLAGKIARQLELTTTQVERIIRASLFHDIGKLGLPKELFSKPGSLTLKEYETIKTHSELGAALLQECDDSRKLISIVRHHHEFFNGKGYPDKIGGNEIELEARIISVADAIDAMSSDHPYRRALSMQQIIAELYKCAGTQFDHVVVEAAVQILRDTGTEQQNHLQFTLNS